MARDIRGRCGVRAGAGAVLLLLSYTVLAWFSRNLNNSRLGAMAPFATVHPEPIHVIMVTVGRDSGLEARTTIKSALMRTSRPIHFHFIGTSDAYQAIHAGLSLVHRPQFEVRSSFYNITREGARDRAVRAGIGKDYTYLIKVFLHEIVLVQRAIFVDTDMIFFADPAQLWDSFDTFAHDTLIALPSRDVPSRSPGQVCSCVMLLNLEAMRRDRFMPSSLLPHTLIDSIGAHAFALGAIDGISHPQTDSVVPFDPLKPFFADQGIYHIVWLYNKSRFSRLSHRWDVTGCRDFLGLNLGRLGEPDGDSMTEAEQLDAQHGADALTGVVSPGLLHFNCFGDSSHVWEVDSAHDSTFGPFVTYVTRYKWIWLNTGEARVTFDQVDWRWWDEIQASALP